MDKGTIAQQLILELSSFSTTDTESALVQEVLGLNNIKSVKNELIAGVLKRKNKTIDEVKEWLHIRNIKSDITILEKFYELQIDEKDRRVDGAYYTPVHIVSYIINQTIKKSGTVCDPACGSGAFLLEAAKKLKAETNLNYSEIYSKLLFGVDIVPINVKKTELLLSLFAILNNEDKKEFSFNIYAGDSLIFDWNKKIKGFSGFDYIVGNPPYVRTKYIRDDVRDNIRKWATGFGNTDLYIPFFELSVNWTNDGGRVGYITPSTYLTSYNAKVARGFLSKNNYIERIIDFNGWQVFQGATTYTCITILNKKGVDKVEFALVNRPEKITQLQTLKFNTILSSSLNGEEWRLLSKEDAENILKIEQAGSPLYQYVNKFITGIATLNNDLFLVEDNSKNYLKKIYGNKVYFIERGITKKIIKPNKIKDKIALQKNRERIIYPYTFKNGKASLISEQMFKSNYPETYKYLSSVKSILGERDKGKRSYKAWYAYGRTQGLGNFGKKIILPMMGNKPSFIIVDDEDSLFYCGYALYPKKDTDYKLLEKILNSKVMWYYLDKTSKNYSGGFKSFAKNYVKNFSIPFFTNQERKKIISIENKEALDNYLWKKYQLA